MRYSTMARDVGADEEWAMKKLDIMLECIARIEKGVAHIEYVVNNGDVPETLDEAEVRRWEERTLRELSEKYGDAFRASKVLSKT